MTKVRKQVADLVRRRADNHCEYCQSHQDFLMSRLQIDHITPVAKGGSNDDINLCLACDACNGYKGQKIGGIDPVSGSFIQFLTRAGNSGMIISSGVRTETKLLVSLHVEE